MTWELEEDSEDRATLRRTTTVTVDRWGEVGPAPPRISYTRRVDLRTRDGISAHLLIMTTVYLDPQASLPPSEEQALRTVGRGVRGGWYFNADGGDLVPAGDYKYNQLLERLSLESYSVGFPDYASLGLTPREQEASLLRYIARLPRVQRGTPSDAAPGGKEATSDDTVEGSVRMATDIVTDFVPGVSNAKDFVTFATGVNPVTGEKVGWLGRLIALVFAIPGIGTLLKWVGKGAKLIVKRLLTSLVRTLGKGGEGLVKWVAKRKWGAAILKWGEALWRRGAKRIRSLIGAKKLKGVAAANARASFTVTEKQVQKKFQKHAADFGVVGNWNPSNAAKFKSAIEQHVQNSMNDVIKGTYHNAPAIIHVDPHTGVAVITDTAGTFVSGWKLSSEQLRNLMAHGNLGGG